MHCKIQHAKAVVGGRLLSACMRLTRVAAGWNGLIETKSANLGLLAAAGVALALAGCSSSTDFAAGTKASPRVVELGDPVPKGGGSYKLGKPYKVAGNWYVPREEPGYKAAGTASWYGEAFHGRYTANGEIYDMETLSAAHPTMPLPSFAQVTNLDNGRKIVVRVNDRGPYAHGRVIDVSKRAAELLDMKHKGLGRVEVAYLGKAPLDGTDGWAVNIPNEAPTTMLASQTTPAPQAAPAPNAFAQQSADMQPQQMQGYLIPASYTPPPPVNIAAAPAAQIRPGAYVLAGTFRDGNNARRLGETIALQGYPVDIIPVVTNGVELNRVRIGPMAMDDAARALSLALASGAQGAKLVEVQ